MITRVLNVFTYSHLQASIPAIDAPIVVPYEEAWGFRIIWEFPKMGGTLFGGSL